MKLANTADFRCRILRAAAASPNFPYGTVLTLTATPAPGAVFRGWRGACGGTSATCVLGLSGAASVTAVFSKLFTDPVLVPRGTETRAAHIAELRSAVRGLE